MKVALTLARDFTRLPSGASISRSTPFRSGAFRCGVGTAHGCTGVSCVRLARSADLRLHVRLEMHHPLADTGCPA